MEISVPTWSSAAYVLKGKRTENDVRLRLQVNVVIPEYTAADAPIIHVIGDSSPHVIKLDGGSTHNRYVPFQTVDGAPAELRLIDDKLYAKRFRADAMEEKLRALDFANPFNGFYRDHIVAGTDYENLSGKTGISKEEFIDRERIVVSKWIDKSDQTFTVINQRASELAIIDGWLYEPVGEPVIVVQKSGDQVLIDIGQAKMPSDVVGRGSVDSAKYNMKFGIDEKDRALSEAIRLVEAGIEAGEKTKLVDNVEVSEVSKWAVRYRGEPEYLYESARSIVESGKEFLREMSPMMGRAWYDLNMALLKHKGISSPAIDAVERLCGIGQQETLESVEEQRRFNFARANWHNSTSGKALAWLDSLKKLEKALYLWQSRSSDGIEWVESGLRGTSTFEGKARAWEVTDLMAADSLAADFQADLTSFMSDASASRGSMIVVEEGNQPKVICLVRDIGGVSEVVDFVTKGNIKPKPHLLTLAASHAQAAQMNRQADDELAFLDI